MVKLFELLPHLGQVVDPGRHAALGGGREVQGANDVPCGVSGVSWVQVGGATQQPGQKRPQLLYEYSPGVADPLSSPYGLLGEE